MGTTYEHHRRDEIENKTESPKSSTKNRKKWCRGKEGVEHHFIKGVVKNRAGYRHEKCSFRDGYQRGKVEQNAYWSCVESEYCDQCGKIKRHYLDKDCTKIPDGVKYTSFLDYLRHARQDAR